MLVAGCSSSGPEQIAADAPTDTASESTVTSGAPVDESASSSTVPLAPPDSVAAPPTLALAHADLGAFVATHTAALYDDHHAVPFLVASSDRFDDLYDDAAKKFRVAVLFGMQPASDGYQRIWSADGDLAASPAPRVLWPASCLGPTPDGDGDGLLDDCDPYPTDGPIADWDGDDVMNVRDNCPSVPNLGQERTGERFSGTACDPREIVHAPIWLVPADITLGDWNQVRAERGLEPIVMPDGPVEQPPEVAQWCSTADLMDADVMPDEAAIRSMTQSIPDAFGLSDSDRDRLGDLYTELITVVDASSTLASGAEQPTTAEELEEAQLAWAALEERQARLILDLQPYFALFAASDIACP